MADRLNEISPIEVKEAEDGDILKKDACISRRAESIWRSQSAAMDGTKYL